MRDLIFLSLEHWDEIWRRNQFLVSRWARRFPDRKILFVGPWQWAHHKTPQFQPLENAPNLRAMALPKLLPNPAPGGRRLNETVAIRAVRKAARELQIREPLLWINPSDCEFFVGRLGERGVVYDITDDWELAESDLVLRDKIHQRDRSLCRRADLTIVCSQALYESRREVAQRCLLLQNGVDFDHYAPSRTFVAGEHAHPVLGFTGSLHPQRIDLKLLSHLSREFSRGTILMIGPDFWLDNGWKRFLSEHPNVQSPGATPWEKLPSAMAPFDLCMVPHLKDEFTESLNPLKLWEYLACGKPIVSTPVAGFRNFPQHVRLVASPEEFATQCREALAENGTPEGAAKANARREEAQKHSWDARFDDLIAELQSTRVI